MTITTELGRNALGEESSAQQFTSLKLELDTIIIPTPALAGSLSATIMGNIVVECYTSERSNTDVLLNFSFKKVGSAFCLT